MIFSLPNHLYSAEHRWGRRDEGRGTICDDGDDVTVHKASVTDISRPTHRRDRHNRHAAAEISFKIILLPACVLLLLYRMLYSSSSREVLIFSFIVSVLGFISRPRSSTSAVAVPVHSGCSGVISFPIAVSTGSGGSFQLSFSI